MINNQLYGWTKNVCELTNVRVVQTQPVMCNYENRFSENVHKFEYVNKDEYMPVRQELENLIHRLQDELRDKLTFRYRFIGSSSRNMITRDLKGNTGYDFDVDIFPNTNDYNPDELKELFRNALNTVVTDFEYDNPEKGTRSLTIKVKDRMHSRVRYSCDFAIKRELRDGRSQYIHFNKGQNSCSWQLMEEKTIRRREEYLRKKGRWGIVRERYLDYKNRPENAQLKSRSIYRKTINDVYNEYR